MTDLVLSVQLETSPGVFLELEDEANGYEIGGGAFAERTLTMKQKTAGDDAAWLRGSLVTASAPGNVTEALEVWVSADDHYTFDQRVQTVITAVTEQLAFQVKRRIGNSLEIWTCAASSQVSIRTQREYILATTGLVTAQIVRQPDVVRSAV